MTSVRTCYCRKEGNIPRKKDNDTGVHSENRYPTTVVSKRPVIKNETCGNSAESAGRTRNVGDDRMPNTNRTMEAQPSNPVLSPETSTALENAEKIINNAKIQLMEVCAISNFDSARQNRNTYSDDPPLDDEAEELLYIRELVASKFYEASSSRSAEADDNKASAFPEERRRVTVRTVDLSAPKFRMSRRRRRRRRADWSFLGYGSDNQSRGRASPAVAPSRDDSSTKGTNEVENEMENEATVRDERRPAPSSSSSSPSSSTTEPELVRARENACGIQIGPSVNIVDRELTRQDLDDVNISPDPSWTTRCRPNTATYTLRHGVAESAASANNEDNELEVTTRTPRTTIRARLDTLQPEKREGPIVVEIAVEDAARVGNSDHGRDDDGRIEPAKSRVQEHIRGEVREDREADPRQVRDTRISERTENAAKRGAINSAVIKDSATGDETLRDAARKENQMKIGFRDETESRYVEDGEIFTGKSNVDDRTRPRNEDTANRIRGDDRNDRSKRPSTDDTSRKMGSPRCENIATENSRPHRTINERFSGTTFDSHNGRDGEPRDIADEEDARRSFASSCSDDFRAEDDSHVVDLYRPRLDDLDSILLSNDKKLERVARATKNFAQLLSKPEFLQYKLNGDKEIPRRRGNRKEFRQESPVIDGDKHEPHRSSTLEIELKNVDLTTVPPTTVAHSRGRTFAENTRSAGFATGNDRRSNCAKNSIESSVFPASDTSDVSEISRDNDMAQRPRTSARPPVSLTDKSDVTTSLSDVVPALSSTRTESSRHRGERTTIPVDRRADATSRDAQTHVAVNKLSAEMVRSPREYPDDVLARTPRGEDTPEAADRFVAFILQDEKRSVEGKVASALEGSAITPTAVKMFLDHLRVAETIRNARRTETLDILKSILVDFTNSIDRSVNEDTKDDRGIVETEGMGRNGKNPSSATDGSIPREENARQTRAEINASERMEENYHLKSSDKCPSDFLERRETNEGVASAVCSESIQNSKGSNKSERNVRQTESVDIAKDTSIDIKGHTDEGVNDKDIKNDEGIADFLIGTDTNAIEVPILQKETKDNASDIGQIDRESYDFKNPDKYPADPSAFRETRVNVRSSARPGSARNSKNNSNSEAESLKQISDIHSDGEKNPDKNLRRSSARIVSVKSNGEEYKTRTNDPNVTIAISEHKGNNAQNNQDDPQSRISREAAKEITIEEVHDNNITLANKNASSVLSKISGIKDERVRSGSAGSKFFAGQVLTKEDVESSRAIGKDLVTEEKVNSENCPRDCASLSSAKNDEPLKEVVSRNEQVSFDIVEIDFAKRSVETRDASTTITAENRGDENENSKFLKKQNTWRKHKTDILSDSNSSVNSTLLDYDDRSTNEAFSLNARRIGTSSETSHSEGELYMPSSCSYSLGEVRILKRDSIENDTIDRDSSVTVLITKSMLTSLNDSTVSLLGADSENI